jgi:TPP-dependent pyruvate/acetoin dehydrogenase alpha subunit
MIDVQFSFGYCNQQEKTKEIYKQIDAAVERAQAAPELTSEQVWEDIYQGTPPPFIRAADITDSKVFSA